MLVVLIIGLDLGQKVLVRDLLGSLAKGFLVNFWEGIEMPLDGHLQSAIFCCRIRGDSRFCCCRRPRCGRCHSCWLVWHVLPNRTVRYGLGWNSIPGAFA